MAQRSAEGRTEARVRRVAVVGFPGVQVLDVTGPLEVFARTAQKHGCKSVAFTYNDPVIFAEYAMDTADACHALGIKSVAVTAGYIHDQPRREFFAKMDAANVDLKGFTDEFYVT